MPEHLQKVREGITDGFAREAFDVKYMQKTAVPNGLKTFEMIIGGMQKKGDLSASLSKQYQSELAAAIRDHPSRLDAPRSIVTDPAFMSSPKMQAAMAVVQDQRIHAVRSEIAVELTRQELVKQYPASEGYRILSEVKVYEDAGFATIADWKQANPGKRASGLTEINGRVVREVTDIDLVVMKDTGAGKSAELVHFEQVKSGKNDDGTDAKDQMNVGVTAIQSGAAGSNIVLRVGTTEITKQINLSSVNSAKQVTRGPEGKDSFDKSVDLTFEQLNQLATEIIK